MGLGGSKGCHPKIQENTVYPGFVCFFWLIFYGFYNGMKITMKKGHHLG